MDFMTKGILPAKQTPAAAGSRTGSMRWVAAAAVVATLAAGLAPAPSIAQSEGAAAPTTAAEEKAPSRLEAGTLACKGEGGWGAVVFSKKTFDCTFTTADRTTRGSYKGTITKIGLDLGFTGDTALVWLVFGPATAVGESYRGGALAGEYVGVGVEATVGAGLGANALVGGSDNHFALQPISVQVQTGLSVAAAVQTLKLEYVGPLN